MAPPWVFAPFPEMVLLRRVKGVGESTYRAPPLPARLSKKVQPLTVEEDPPLRKRPPPMPPVTPAKLPLTVVLLSVNDAVPSAAMPPPDRISAVLLLIVEPSIRMLPAL